jgi:O-antigen ligase
LDMSNLVSAHNGYIEVYLDLGLVGLCLLLLILISGYRRAVEAFRRNRELGSLVLAYILTGVFYNITEAGFRLMSPSWVFPLLAVVTATGVTIGLYSEKSTIPASRRQRLGVGNEQAVFVPRSGVSPI